MLDDGVSELEDYYKVVIYYEFRLYFDTSVLSGDL